MYIYIYICRGFRFHWLGIGPALERALDERKVAMIMDIYIYIYIYTHVYIYIYRERERCFYYHYY